jgi:RNA polymerase sigma factor (sigma-70 family)
MQNGTDHLAGVFATTHWSVVLDASHATPGRSRAALESLCSKYWYPLFVYVRRCGYAAPDAQDLTQQYFLQLLSKNWLAQANRERGRFRSFLLASMKHFLANEWDKLQAAKRGGKLHFLSLDFDTAETRLATEPSHDQSPDKAYDRQWAMELLDQVLAALKNEYAAMGKGHLFNELKEVLSRGREAGRYSELGQRLGMSEGAVKVAVHRLRHRYRELLQLEIARTVADASQIQDELRHLFQALTES